MPLTPSRCALAAFALIAPAAAFAADYDRPYRPREVVVRETVRRDVVVVPRASHPSDYAENRLIPMTGNLPACDDPKVLSELTGSFDSREAKFWGPLRIVGFESAQPLAYRPWGLEYIPRRFCTGRVVLNDGMIRRVDYSVREGLGFLSAGWNVNWCVSGLDRNRTYAPDCQMARP